MFQSQKLNDWLHYLGGVAGLILAIFDPFWGFKFLGYFAFLFGLEYYNAKHTTLVTFIFGQGDEERGRFVFDPGHIALRLWQLIGVLVCIKQAITLWA